MSQFNQFAGAGNPHCFGTYDASDSECRRCPVDQKCYPVTRDRAASNPHTTSYAPPTSAPPPAALPYATSYAPQPPAAPSSVLRPAPLKDFPLGTEMLPVGEEGQHGPVRRAVTGAVKEAVAYGGGAFFDSLSRFIKDISAWDTSVGERRYGDNWRRPEAPRRAASVETPAGHSPHALPPHAQPSPTAAPTSAATPPSPPAPPLPKK